MKKLNPDWLLEGVIDFEYKKYILLAYLQEVSKSFNDSKLYPFLSDLIFHYNNLKSIKEKKQFVANQFPKQISRLDLENFKIEYERMMHDDEYLEEIESIIDFAIPRMQGQLEEGRELYEFVEDKLEIQPVGILPLNTDAGYMFIKQPDHSDTKVYEYEITIFENREEKYRGIKTNYITSYQKSITTTYESMKLDLIKRYQGLPNPAAFLVATKLYLPLQETFLPVAKRYFVRYIAGLSEAS